jgi:hypothetical protein
MYGANAAGLADALIPASVAELGGEGVMPIHTVEKGHDQVCK